MPVTLSTYKITATPSRVIPLSNGVPMVVDTDYPQVDALTFQKPDGYHYGEPYDTVEIKVNDGTLESNTAIITVNFPPDKNLVPSSANYSNAILNLSSNNFKTMMPINDGVDRIKLISFGSYGQIELNGNPIFPNTTIMRYDLENLNYIAPEFGLGEPIQTITYQVGNADGFDATIYTITLDIVGQADLVLISTDQELEVGPPDFYTYGAVLEIQNGYVGLTAQFTVNISGIPFPGSTSESFVYINDTQTQANGVLNLEVVLDSLGKGYITIEVEVLDSDAPVAGTIDITLDSIDGDSGKVSLTNNVSLPINF